MATLVMIVALTAAPGLFPWAAAALLAVALASARSLSKSTLGSLWVTLSVIASVSGLFVSLVLQNGWLVVRDEPQPPVVTEAR